MVKLHLIDVGESSEVKTRVETHDRKECWERNCKGIIKYAAYYVEHGKENYNIPCGEK